MQPDCYKVIKPKLILFISYPYEWSFEQFKQFKTGGNDCNDNNNINTNSKKPGQESGAIFEIKNKRVLVNTHSNLDISAGDTIMISNIINVLLENDNKVTLVSKFPITKNFTRNLIVEDNNNNHSSNFTSFTPTDSSDPQIVSSIDEYSNNMDIIFLRNHEILHLLENKNYLFKTIISKSFLANELISLTTWSLIEVKNTTLEFFMTSSLIRFIL